MKDTRDAQSIGIRSIVLMFSVVGAGLLAACSPRALPSPPKAAHTFVFDGLSKGPGPMRDPIPSRFDADLAKVGLTPGDLPPLEQLESRQIMTVMRSFSESLGVPCSACHDLDAFHADTRRKRVAKRMWNEFVRTMAFEGAQGNEPQGTLYCDSCHQGRLAPLDRRDKDKVVAFMNDAYVGKLRRIDGKDHECGTCHGDPPDFQILLAWKNEPAPDVSLAVHVAEVRALPAPTTLAPAAPKPAPKPRPKAPAPKTFAASGSCGDKNNPCPLQKWMRVNIAPAVTADDSAALAKALAKAADLSPDPSWKWKEISLAAAEAAKKGDVLEARKSCRGCHDLYKNDYKAKYRGRPVP